MREEIRIKVNGGYLVATGHTDPNYPGIYIMYETDDGYFVDVTQVECKTENNHKKIDVYCYENEYNEDFTRKYALDREKIYKAIERKLDKIHG